MSEKFSRREFLRSSALVAAAGIGGVGPLLERTKGMNKPNIIFFFTDQQRWDTVGCYGQKMRVTPNLDRMAAAGVRFENAFTCQPVCGPARSCIQSGKYASETGCFRNGIGLPTGEKTIAEHLSEAGYEVGYIGKWHLTAGKDCVNNAVPREFQGGYKDYWLASNVLEFTSHGYDGHMYDADMKQVDFKGYRVDCQTDFAIEYLRTRDRKKPFFLCLSYLEPHFQNDHKHFEGPDGSKERFKDFTPPCDLVGHPEGDWQEEYPDYLGCCASLDHNLGRIRVEMEKLGLTDNTLIIFTSDHGCHFRTRNGEYKRSCHESSIRVPMVAYGPGFKGGKVVDGLVSLIDIAPTILAVGAVSEPRYMRGRPLQDLASGKAKDWPEEVFVQISEAEVGRAIRTKKWKYCVYAPDKSGGRDPGSDVYVEEFLYDLDADPCEQNNLVKDPGLKSVRADLAEILKRHMKRAGEKTPRIVNSEQ